jgi:hypothetical protein
MGACIVLRNFTIVGTGPKNPLKGGKFMKALMTVLCSLLLGGACYFAFQSTGVYSMEGAAGDIPETVLEDTLELEDSLDISLMFDLEGDPPTLARYHCHNPLCLHEWTAPPGGMPCPKCNTFADDFDLIDDDDFY